jgi:hypothetical protein
VHPRGLDPTLGAVLPLIGVLLGAAAAGGLTYVMRRRDERGELRAVARVLVEELASTAGYLLHVIDGRQWSWLPGDAAASVQPDAWQEHHLLIARHVTDDRDWRTVAEAFRLGRVAGLLVAGCIEHAEKDRYGRELVAKLRAGADVLRPLAYRDGAERLVRRSRSTRGAMTGAPSSHRHPRGVREVPVIGRSARSAPGYWTESGGAQP